MSDRIERHRAMAQERIRAHMAMTQAHMAGRVPVSMSFDSGPVEYFTPQSNKAIIVEGGYIFGKDGQLRELRMYWDRVPDFGIKEFEVFPSESGWAQVLYWRGTTVDGQEIAGQEADIIRTDENFNVIRVEYYCESKQWTTLAAIAQGVDPETFDLKKYYEVLDKY